MHRVVRVVGLIAVAWFVTDAAAAQQPAAATVAGPSWSFDAVPGAISTVIVVAWDHGYEDDVDGECGLAKVLADCRLAWARQAVPEATDTGVMVLGDVTLAFASLPAGSPQVPVFAAALLAPAAGLTDDQVAVFLARAALGADDAAWLYPGLRIETQARAALFAGQPAGRPVAGRAEDLQNCGVPRVRERLAAPVAVRGWLLGAPVAAMMPALPSLARTARAAAVAAKPSTESLSSRHPRLDGPFVAAAFARPADVSWRDWAMALEVARLRAARQLRLRGGEALARAPLVGWSWRADEPLVLLQRRGFNGDPPDAAQRELSGLLDELRTSPPTARELSSAAGGLAAEMAMPPWQPALAKVLAGASGALVGRGIAVALARWRQLDAVDFGAATAAEVHAAMRRCFAAERALWLVLEPAPNPVPPRR